MKTPTHFECVLLFSRQIYAETEDVDSRSNHKCKTTISVLHLEVVHVEGNVCGRWA